MRNARRGQNVFFSPAAGVTRDMPSWRGVRICRWTPKTEIWDFLRIGAHHLGLKTWGGNLEQKKVLANSSPFAGVRGVERLSYCEPSAGGIEKALPAGSQEFVSLGYMAVVKHRATPKWVALANGTERWLNFEPSHGDMGMPDD